LPLAFASYAWAEEGGLTFFGWSDQHVQTDGRSDHLLPAIDAMNALPGTPFPENIGGRVPEPAFVFGCGDVTEWPTQAAVKNYEQLIKTKLRWPAYDILGNHDEGGNSPSETMKRWILARHGALSYTLEAGGIRFLAMYSKYDESLNNPAQPLSGEALAWLHAELTKAPPRQPVIVATHLCFDAMTNRDQLVDALRGANVLAVLGGHYHKSKVDRYRDIDFVQLPSPAPKNTTPEITVFRITPNRVLAIPYDYRDRAWKTGPGKMLDKTLSHGSVGK
jgi:hypothetical protein